MGELDCLEELLKKHYHGTKSYHNFTSGKQKGDEAAKRHILSFEVFGQPFECEGWEYIELRVKGQSFMIHQIRKMIGLMIARCSGNCDDKHIQRAFEENFEDIPKAPGNGLVLCQVHYDQYNIDWGSKEGYSKLEWNEVQEEINDFAKKSILPQIFALDIESNNMMNWLKGMSLHDFTGEGAKEQYQLWENERKRKAETNEAGPRNSKID